MDANENFNVDVVIVGSGVAGALIAKQLGLAGKDVLILEAGPEIPRDINGYMDRFFKAKAKVPESPYPPELLAADGKFNDPSKVNAGRANSIMLAPIAWKDPSKSYLSKLARSRSAAPTSGSAGAHRCIGSAPAFASCPAISECVRNTIGSSTGPSATMIWQGVGPRPGSRRRKLRSVCRPMRRTRHISASILRIYPIQCRRFPCRSSIRSLAARSRG